MRDLRDAFATPGVRRLMVLSLLARLPQGMASLAVLLHVTHVTGSTGLGGSAAGAWAFGACVAQPTWTRVMRHAPARPVLLLTSALQAALAVALATGESVTALLSLAAAGGLASPPVSSIARGLWPDIVPEAGHLQRVYGVDATVQELIFIVGPALVAAVTAVRSPAAALWSIGVLGLVGNAALARSPLMARPPVRVLAGSSRVWRPMRRLVLVSLLLTFAFGATEVAVPAVAIEAGRPAAGGVLLALISLGSLIGGLGAAAVRRQLPPLRQLRVCGIACALSTGLLAWAASNGLAWTGAAAFLSGLTISPALAGLYALVAGAVSAHRRTEAFALMVSAFLAGIAAGSAAAGWLSEHLSPSAALLAAAPLPVVAVVASRGVAHEAASVAHVTA